MERRKLKELSHTNVGFWYIEKRARGRKVRDRVETPLKQLREKKAKNFLNSVGKLISNSIRETTGKSGMIEKDTILLFSLLPFFSHKFFCSKSWQPFSSLALNSKKWKRNDSRMTCKNQNC